MIIRNYTLKKFWTDSFRSGDSERSLKADEYLTEFKEPVRVWWMKQQLLVCLRIFISY